MITFQSIPEAIPIGLAVVISGALAFLAWRRRAMPMAPAFATMMAGETAWAVGAALEPIIVELPFKRLCIDLRIVGTVIAILGLLAFVFRFTGLFRWLKTPRFAALCAAAIPLIVLAWTDPWHHLYFARLSNDTVGKSSIAIRSFGPGFGAMFLYCYALVAVSSALLVRAAIHSTGVYRAQAAVMLFGAILPWAVDIMDMTRMIPFIPVDLVSPTFVVTGLTFLPALYRLHLLDLPPAARAAVIERMDDPVVVIDPKGRIVELNPAAERLIGRKSDEVAGSLAALAFSRWTALGDRRPRVEGHGRTSELGGPDANEASLFDSRISPLGADLRSCGWVLVLRDLSALKLAEEERAHMLKEQAARAEAEADNRAKDRFLATLSHELRTPLNPILATVTAMLDDPATPVAIRTVLEMIRRNVSLEARLIDDLLDRTRIKSGKLHLEREVIDAHELVQHVVEICSEDLRAARLQLVLDLSARHHKVSADPVRLRQVLWNLLENAIKFTPPEGTVTVSSRDADASAEGTAGTRLILEISDTGIGIEPEVLSRISDIELPDGSGLELMWKIRSRCATPGIAISGFVSSEDIEQSRAAGFTEHLTKPVDFRRLEEAIQQVAGRS